MIWDEFCIEGGFYLKKLKFPEISSILTLLQKGHHVFEKTTALLFLIIVSTIARVTGGIFRLSEKFSILDTFFENFQKMNFLARLSTVYKLKNICPRVSLVFSKKEMSLSLIDILLAFMKKSFMKFMNQNR